MTERYRKNQHWASSGCIRTPRTLWTPANGQAYQQRNPKEQGDVTGWYCMGPLYHRHTWLAQGLEAQSYWLEVLVHRRLQNQPSISQDYNVAVSFWCDMFFWFFLMKNVKGLGSHTWNTLESLEAAWSNLQDKSSTSSNFSNQWPCLLPRHGDHISASGHPPESLHFLSELFQIGPSRDKHCAKHDALKVWYFQQLRAATTNPAKHRFASK